MHLEVVFFFFLLLFSRHENSTLQFMELGGLCLDLYISLCFLCMLTEVFGYINSLGLIKDLSLK